MQSSGTLPVGVVHWEVALRGLERTAHGLVPCASRYKKRTRKKSPSSSNVPLTSSKIVLAAVGRALGR